MKIFDLHNDVAVECPKRIGSVLKRSEAVLAVWTTELAEPLSVFRQVELMGANWAIEDIGFCDDLSILRQFKPLYASLTWNYENKYAFGASVEGGLKPQGIDAIAALEGLGITLDTAHLSRTSFFDAAALSKRPFICSHTCFCGVFDHKRNLCDQQIWAIIESGGIIGLTFVADFMGVARAGVVDVVKQIEYFCARFPLERLCIGSDFFGTKAPALKNYSGFKRLKKELLNLNYSQEQIDKIFYENAHAFFFRGRQVV